MWAIWHSFSRTAGLKKAVQPHVPTSAALAQLLNEAPQDRVTLAWLLGRLQKRSFGLLMLLLALLGLVPGAGVFIGVSGKCSVVDHS